MTIKDELARLHQENREIKRLLLQLLGQEQTSAHDLDAQYLMSLSPEERKRKLSERREQRRQEREGFHAKAA